MGWARRLSQPPALAVFAIGRLQPLFQLRVEIAGARQAQVMDEELAERGRTKWTSIHWSVTRLTLANRTWAMNATRVLAGMASYGPHVSTARTNRRNSERPPGLAPARKASTECGPHE